MNDENNNRNDEKKQWVYRAAEILVGLLLAMLLLILAFVIADHFVLVIYPEVGLIIALFAAMAVLMICLLS